MEVELDASIACGSASDGASAEVETDTEVLALVCPVMPAGGFQVVGDEEAEREHMSALSIRRESLKFVLAHTLTNLAYFTEQCKSNPSCEVPSSPPPSLQRCDSLSLSVRCEEARLRAVSHECRFDVFVGGGGGRVAMTGGGFGAVPSRPPDAGAGGAQVRASGDEEAAPCKTATNARPETTAALHVFVYDHEQPGSANLL